MSEKHDVKDDQALALMFLGILAIGMVMGAGLLALVLWLF